MSAGFKPEVIKTVELFRPGYQRELAESINEHGYARFNDMRSPEQLARFGRMLGSVILHRDADSLGVTTVTPTVVDPNLPSRLGFTDKELVLHTDGTAVEDPATLLALYCDTPARHGGETSILDGKRLHTVLQEQNPDLLQKLEAPGSAVFGDLSQNPYVGSVFSRDDSGLVTVRFRADEYGYYPLLSDGEQEELVETMQANADTFKLEEGEGYIVNNRRALHARAAFQGNRVMQRVLINDIDPDLEYPIEIGFKSE